MGKHDFKEIAEFKFECGAYIDLASHYVVEVKPGLDGLMALCRLGIREHNPVPFTPDMAEKLAELLGECGVDTWKREYEPPDGWYVLDGYFWNLRIVFDNGDVIESEGSNGWPKTYAKLEIGLVELFGMPEDADTSFIPGDKERIWDEFCIGDDKFELDENGDVIPDLATQLLPHYRASVT